MPKKKKTRMIKYDDDNIIMFLDLSRQELTVLKCALKHYDNHYGNQLLKRIEKEEEN